MSKQLMVQNYILQTNICSSTDTTHGSFHSVIFSIL
uniref:Uncharacterized protein n=1 Tax=Anguilla anguilla TaxID=7936 RepID=A0A0E9QV69_ANGAN